MESDDVILRVPLVSKGKGNLDTIIPAGTKCTVMDISVDKVTLQADDSGLEIVIDYEDADEKLIYL